MLSSEFGEGILLAGRVLLSSNELLTNGRVCRMQFGREGECVTVRPTRSACVLLPERKEHLNGSPGFHLGPAGCSKIDVEV